jgi:predicted nucleotidyltransferase
MDKIKFKRMIEILRSYGAKEITLFGSYARGDNRPDSDVDVMVEFDETKSLIILCRIIRVIKEELGIKIDLVTKNAISQRLLPYIQKDMKVIYPS